MPLNLQHECLPIHVGLAISLLQKEVFEDSIVDFFETADVNKDAVIECTDFYNVSHTMQ